MRTWPSQQRFDDLGERLEGTTSTGPLLTFFSSLFLFSPTFSPFPSSFVRGIKQYEPPRYMTINQCIEQLLEIEAKRGEKVYSSETLGFGVARLGQANQQIVSGTLQELLTIDFGGPLHSLVLAAPEIHDIELAMWEYFHWDKVRRSAEQKRAKEERAVEEAKEEAERLARIAEAEKANPTVVRSTMPKVKAPVKASSSAPTMQQESDSEDEVAMEPLF